MLGSSRVFPSSDSTSALIESIYRNRQAHREKQSGPVPCVNDWFRGELYPRATDSGIGVLLKLSFIVDDMCDHYFTLLTNSLRAGMLKRTTCCRCDPDSHDCRIPYASETTGKVLAHQIEGRKFWKLYFRLHWIYPNASNVMILKVPMLKISTVPEVPSHPEAILAQKTKQALGSRSDMATLDLRAMDVASEPTIRIPATAVRLLLQILDEVSQGHAVKVVPVLPELTTQEAADLLNVSRPTLIQLLGGAGSSSAR